MKNLKKELELAISKYVKLFEKKHDIDFEFWVADLTGTIGCFSNEWYIDFETIRLDLEQNVDKGLFFDWYDLSFESHIKDEPVINYYTFLKQYK